MTQSAHISSLFGAKGTAICLKSEKICPRLAHFSLRFFKSDRLLVSAFEKLVINPSLGLASGHIRDGYRRYLSGRHVIYFQATTYGAAIIRVLHERMNAPQHL
jgi:hypothetical protein